MFCLDGTYAFTSNDLPVSIISSCRRKQYSVWLLWNVMTSIRDTLAGRCKVRQQIVCTFHDGWQEGSQYNSQGVRGTRRLQQQGVCNLGFSSSIWKFEQTHIFGPTTTPCIDQTNNKERNHNIKTLVLLVSTTHKLFFSVTECLFFVLRISQRRIFTNYLSL